MASLDPDKIVPGHGPVSSLERAQSETGDYLDWLVTEVDKAIKDWKDIGETVETLSAAPKFKHLKHFSGWHRTNVSRVYEQLEAEQ